MLIKGKGTETCAEVERRADSEPKPSRKPYQRPEFRCERIFETMALACGKVSQTQKQCRFRTRSS
jgi:hypothetical protein